MIDQAEFAAAIESGMEGVPMATRLYPDYYSASLATYLIGYLEGADDD